MKNLILTWAILRLIWESKGYSMKEMPDLLKARWPRREGFAFASIQRKSQLGKKAPADVARVVMDAEQLPVREGHEKTAEVVRLGLAALRGQPIPNRQPPARARPLLARARRLARLARRLARLIAKRLAGELATSGKLDTLQATCNHTDARIDGLVAKLDRSTAEILRAVRSSGGLAGGFAGGLVVCAAMILVNCQHSSTSAARVPQVSRAPELATITPQPVIIVTSAVQGGTPFVFDLNTLLGAVTGQMGKKLPPEQLITTSPMPGQKPPPCDAELGETAINGGCWGAMMDVKPPCRRLFRDGDKCYRPIAADPQKPVLVSPREPGREVPW